jgi:hypothetical protein
LHADRGGLAYRQGRPGIQAEKAYHTGRGMALVYRKSRPSIQAEGA